MCYLFESKSLDKVSNIFCLVNVYSSVRLLYLQSLKVGKFTYHAYFKHLFHFICSKKIISRAKNNIININLSYNKVILILPNEKSSISISSLESIPYEIRSQSIISSSRSLFKTIQYSFQFVDITRPMRIHKSFGLLYIHFFLQHPIQESTFDIHLIQLEIQVTSNG